MRNLKGFKNIILVLLVITLFTTLYMYKPYLSEESSEENTYKEGLSDEEHIIYNNISQDEEEDYKEINSNGNEKDNELEENEFEDIFYYIESYHERYENYFEQNNDLSLEEVILDVNMNLDYDFYHEDIIKEVSNSDDLLVICNKYYKLPYDFKPNDLKPLNSNNNYYLREEALDALNKMIESANNEGVSLWVVSAYRSNDTQRTLYNRYVEQNGLYKADTFSARPGHSEHETGLAIDFNQISQDFDQTKAFEWLYKNSYKYGFILRYPYGKTDRTGYIYEPWHYRYVGVDVAKEIYEKNLLFDEYYAMYILPEKN